MKKTPLRRSKGVRPRNAKRRASEFKRCYHSKERVAFVAALRCIARTTMCNTPIDNAHIQGDGAGRKAGYEFIVPLCRFHHEALHHEGRAWFEEMFMLDLDEARRATADAWEQHIEARDGE